MARVLEEFQWGVLIQKLNNRLTLRLRILSEWMMKAWTINAENYEKPPLKYLELKR